MAAKEIFELGELFEQVQMNQVYGDGKTFPDCLPKKDIETISKVYQKQKDTNGFDLKTFVNTYFDEPAAVSSGYESDMTKSLRDHINQLWEVLTRKPVK